MKQIRLFETRLVDGMQLVRQLLFCWAVFLLNPLASAGERCEFDDLQRKVCTEYSSGLRVVTLSPHATEIVAWLIDTVEGGKAPRLVAVDSASDFPAWVSGLPVVSDKQQLSKEAVLSLKPDLVVAWASGISAESLSWLERLQISVFLSEPNGVDGVARNLRSLGALMGLPSANLEKASRDWLAGFGEPIERQTPVRVFYQVWERPLITVGGPHVISDLITRCGGENIFQSLPQLGPTVSVESVLQRNPQVIMASGPENPTQQALKHWQKWSTIEAVKGDRFSVLPQDILVRPGPRLLQAKAALCTEIERLAPNE